MKRKFTLALMLLMVGACDIFAQVSLSTTSFNWSRIENSTPVAPLATNDADNGDGAGDGAMQIKGTANTPALQGIQYLLGGTPTVGEQINLEIKYYQNDLSYVAFKMQVFNKTDNLVLAQTASLTTSSGVVGTGTLSYIFTSASVGDEILVRFVRTDDLNPVRIAAIDYLKVNSQFASMVPPPVVGQLKIDSTRFNWSKLENNTPVSLVKTDADNGDGVNDGALELKPVTSTTSLRGLQYLLGGAPVEYEKLDLEIAYYQTNLSYVGFKMQVFNKTDSVVLAETASLGSSSAGPKFATLSYTFGAASVGDEIVIRFVRNDDFNLSRVAAIDYLKVNSKFVSMVPPTVVGQLKIDEAHYNWSKLEDSNAKPTIVLTDADNGDGVNDGALELKPVASTPSLRGLQYLLGGAPVEYEKLDLEIAYYQTNASYVGFRMQVFNKTDNVVLAETAGLASSSTGPKFATLSYTFGAESVGDEIAIRFVRTDDFNTSRVAAIDYLKVNSKFVNMWPLCEPVFNFDLPLTTATQTEIDELATIRARLSDQFVGTVPPTTAEMDAAIAQYDLLNITVSGGTINGNPVTSTGQYAFLKTFAKYLKFNPADTVISNKAVNAIWYLSKQNCNQKNDALTFYNYPNFAQSAVFLNSYLPDHVKALFGNTLYTETGQFKHMFDPVYSPGLTSNAGVSTDVIYLCSNVLLAYADWFKTNDEKIRYLKTLKRFLERFLTYSDAKTDGIKKDGTGYHHGFFYDGYMYAYDRLATVLTALSNTSFQVNQASYLVFRNAVYAQTMYSNDAGLKPFSMSGRNPQIRNTTLIASTLAKTAIVGGKILGLATADEVAPKSGTHFCTS